MLGIGLGMAAATGIALGLMGGGGSILMVPIFVYVLGFAAKEAIALSLAVVGAVSAFGALAHWRAGNVNVRVAVVFGLVAMVGAYGGARLSVLFAGSTQLLLFAGVMLAAAYFMFRGRGDDAGASDPGARPDPGAKADPAAKRGPATSPDPAASPGARPPMRPGLIVVEGLAVGALAGLVGVGGGFLIVPALVLLADIPMKEAVGTSLLVIAMNSAAGFSGYLGQVVVPWGFLAVFAGVAVVGIIVGTQLVRYVSQDGLRRAFAVFLVVMGFFILYRNRSELVPGDHRADVEGMEAAAPVRAAAAAPAVSTDGRRAGGERQ